MPPAQRLTVDAALAGLLFLASSGTVQQYTGLAGVGAYLAVLAVAVPVATRVVLPLLRSRLSERAALVLALLTWLVLLVAVVVVYPHANSHAAGVGSDRDDAANVATRHLFHLQYPYETPTYLGNPVSQLPGALLLDAPFVALGSSAYQNLLWIAILFALLLRVAGDARVALWASWLVLAASPAVLRELLTGGDVIANTVAVLAFGAGAVELPRRWQRGVCALLLGVALAWRPNFLYWLPLLAVVSLRRRGARETAWSLLTALAALAALVLPFYLTHRHGFAPLQTANKVRRYDDLVPRSSVVILGTTALLALALAWRRVEPFLGAAAVQVWVLGFVVVLSSIEAHRPDFSFLVIAYGIFFLFPGVVGLVRVGGLSSPARCAAADSPPARPFPSSRR